MVLLVLPEKKVEKEQQHLKKEKYNNKKRAA
jgi:hypothetical protein